MSPIITELAPPVATEGFILDPDGVSPLDLVGGTWGMVALTIPPAPRRPEWASNGDSDGSSLVREPYYNDRVCSMQLRVHADTMDQAVNAIGLLEGKLQEAITLAAGGGPGMAFLWTPAGASTGLTGYIKLAEITDMPVDWNGWFQARPTVTIAFTAKPFLYGDEVSGGSVTSSLPLVTLEVDSVPGDVPAEARLVITDESTEARRWVEWGLESRYFDAASPAPLFIDSGSLITSGFAGAGTALSGAYGGTAIGVTLLSQPTAVCGVAGLPHVGTFRVKARTWGASTDEYWRLTWQEADGLFLSNAWAVPVAGSAFSELDFGLVTILPPVEAGTQTWSGRFEAYTTTPGGEFGALDYVELFPVDEGYGRLEGAYAYTPGVIDGWDDFNGVSGTLNSRAAAAGGTWATSGATTDFSGTALADFEPDGYCELRTTNTAETGPRFAILGSGSFTDCEVSFDIFFGTTYNAQKSAFAIARYVDGSNFAFAEVARTGTGAPNDPIYTLSVGTMIAGVKASVLLSTLQIPFRTVFKVRLVAFASGRMLAWVWDFYNGTLYMSGDAFVSGVATGGALASGKAGFADQSYNTTNTNRQYGYVFVGVPSPENVIINSTKSLEVRSDSNLRQSTNGSSYGDIPSRGSRLFVPQAGDAARSTRIAVRATREDPITSASRNDGDSLKAEIFYTPRYLAVPRS